VPDDLESALDDERNARIVRLVGERGEVQSSDVGEVLGISRQAAHPRLKWLVQRGLLERVGAGRSTRYRLPRAPEAWERRYQTAGLEEHRVWEELRAAMPSLVPTEAVFSYAVTELVNNAIDHSESPWVRVSARRLGGLDSAQSLVRLEIEDGGVGVFRRVMQSLGLPSELDALQEITKGKTTTAPDRHSGEGLFFVSKAADQFRLESGRWAWIVDNDRSDMAIAEIPDQLGTLAIFEANPNEARNLAALFAQYTDNLDFAKTRITIKLFEYGTQFVSRSEAKRLVHGLERFREVLLDFAGVRMVGQGFADQVFRVWAHQHPAIRLTPINMPEAVAFMVQRASR
jgi:anti-sigma regulatory factor (Ser/Thr protein kinase)